MILLFAAFRGFLCKIVIVSNAIPDRINTSLVYKSYVRILEMGIYKGLVALALHGYK